MRLSFVHHSCFLLEFSRAYVIIDFWQDSQDGIVSGVLGQADKPIYVLASHAHQDHFNPEVLFWGPNVRYVLSADIRRRNKPLRDDPRIAWLHRGECFADDNVRVSAFGSTDVGVSFLVEADGLKVFHAGDFNDWQSPSRTEPENVQMHNYFVSELAKMTPHVAGCHVALFPVDSHLGSAVVDGVQQFCNAVHPLRLVPMHMWGDFAQCNSALQHVVAPSTLFCLHCGSLTLEIS